MLRYIGLILLSTLVVSCNLSKWVPEGEYRLDENEVLVDGKSAPSRVKNIIKQQPPSAFLNAIHSWGNPNDSTGFDKWLSEQGEPPAVLSIPLTERTREQLSRYYFNQGYFHNKTKYHLEIDTPRRDVDVIYEISLGPQYTIRSLSYEIPSPNIEELVRSDSANCAFELGEPYSAALLEEERQRLSDLFRNDGFFGFSKEWIRFRADTAVGDHGVHLILRILDRPVRTQDTSYSVSHQRYSIEDVYVDYGFNYLELNATYADTNSYEDYNFLIRDSVRYHPHLISRAIHFTPGDRFNSDVIKESYTHLSTLGVFGATEIEFTPIENDSNYRLNAFIKLTPLDKRRFFAELEGTSTSNFYGIKGNLGWLNRNLFGAGEILDLRLVGGIQAQLNYRTGAEQTLFNTYEIGAEAGLSYSRFLLPLSLQALVPKKWRPSTRLATSYSQQTRIEFQRRIVRLGATFQAKPWDDVTVQLSIPELNYVNLIDFDTAYINSLFFKTGFQDNLLASVRTVVNYDPRPSGNQLIRHSVRVSLESSGFLLSQVDGNFNMDPETGQRTLFDVPYAQYVKFDIDYRNYLAVGPKSRFVSRLFLGVTHNYGNSPFLPPFEKNFLAGGSQDIRGWIAYRLGPGELPYAIYDRESYAAVAPIKAMVNFEYRFPILGSLNGATFIDAGNVWLWDRNYRLDDFEGLTEAEIESAVFKWNRVFRSSAVGTGFGLRYDFGFFQLRLDGGVKVWDPSEPDGYQFVLDGLQWRTVTFNFGLNYPF